MNFAEKVLARLTDNNIQEAMRIAAIDTVAEMTPRIFEDGKNSRGGRIGAYSRKPLSILKTDMPKQVSGTRSSSRSVFFQGGYSQYKRELGYNRVNWRNFGTLMRDFATPKETLRGRSISYRVKQQNNQEKLDYLVDHYSSDVVELTKSESDNLNKVFLFELEKRLFNGL